MKLDGEDAQLIGAAGTFFVALLIIAAFLFSHRADFRG
jgi:hypothetical protein